jgi:anaerobic magnesium-protoporphyrin IX monomethyl ester cyclase
MGYKNFILRLLKFNKPLVRKFPLRAVVIIPPVFDFYFTPHRSSGLGGEILLQLLQANGFQADLLNFPIRSKRAAKQNLPQALNHLKPYFIENEFGPLSFFLKYQRFGPSISECARQALQTKPDLICISCFAFCYAQAALDLAETIRSLNPLPAIIIGGAGVSAYPEYFIKNPAVDFVIIGEAEVSVPLFLDIFKSRKKNFSAVPNLYFKSDGKMIAPSQVKRTKAEDISFILKKTFETSDKKFFTTALSRGCPKTCRFCSNFLSHGRTFRTISLENVQKKLTEIDYGNIKNQKKICINLEDDNLLCNPDYFLSALKSFNQYSITPSSLQKTASTIC